MQLTERYYPVAILTATALFLIGIVLSFYISDIGYRSDITEYFEPDHPMVTEFHEFEAAMGSQQSLLILLQRQQGQFLDPGPLTQLYQLQHQLSDISGIERIQSLLSSAVSDLNQNTTSLLQWLAQQRPITESILGQMADNLAMSPGLLSPSGQVTALTVHFSTEEAIVEAYPMIQDLLAAQSFSDLEPLLLGPVEIKQALHQSLIHDGFYLMPVVMLCGIGLLWFFIRSVWLIVSGAASIILALWLCAGFSGFFQFTINQTSALAFCVAFIIALADIIHLLMGYSQRREIEPPRLAMLQTLRFNGMPLLLTSITTSIGFLSLNLSSSPSFATFGNIAAIGVACAFISAVTLTPVLVLLNDATSGRTMPPYFNQMIELFTRRRKRFRPVHYWVFYSLSLLICVLALNNQFHNDPLEYFSADSPITQAKNVSENEFNVHYPLSIRVDSGRADGIFQSSVLRTLGHFETWALNHPAISQSSSFASRLKPLNRHLHEGNLKWSQAPRSAPTAADLWNLYQMASPQNQPEDLGLDSQFKTATVTLGVRAMKSAELRALSQEIKDWFAHNNPDLTIAVTGHSVLFAGIGRELTHNMLIGGLITAVVISLLIGLFLGHFKLGLLVLIPNLFPAGMVYGLWGATVGIIDIAAAGTLAISLGIIVDDSIHILKHYIEYRRQGMLPEAAIDKTFQEVGPALLLTTVVLASGMLVLTLSSFNPNQTTGLFIASNISLALAYDLLMLPHLLKVADRWLFPELASQQQQPA